jgi:hypothetical protein
MAKGFIKNVVIPSATICDYKKRGSLVLLLNKAMKGKNRRRNQKGLGSASARSDEMRKAGEKLLEIQERTQKYAGDRTPKDWETFKRWMREGLQ